MLRKIILTSSFCILSAMAGQAFAVTVQNANDLTNGIYHSKNRIDSIIMRCRQNPACSQAASRSPHAPTNSPWSSSSANVNENDAFALPILIQASASLGQAGSLSDEAKQAFLVFNIALANFKFASACNKMGISRSQIARANTAALSFPAGFLAAFGPELTDTVTELNQLRFSEGCP